MSELLEWIKSQGELNDQQVQNWTKQLELDESLVRALAQTRFLIGVLFGAVVALTVWSVLR
jgi:hypothetical protein